jgi:hypothetical protein
VSEVNGERIEALGAVAEAIQAGLIDLENFKSSYEAQQERAWAEAAEANRAGAAYAAKFDEVSGLVAVATLEKLGHARPRVRNKKGV